ARLRQPGDALAGRRSVALPPVREARRHHEDEDRAEDGQAEEREAVQPGVVHLQLGEGRRDDPLEQREEERREQAREQSPPRGSRAWPPPAPVPPGRDAPSAAPPGSPPRTRAPRA